MAANIARFKGRAAMMSVGARPWHGLGVGVEGAQTAEKAIQLAGLDWEVEKRPVYLREEALVAPALTTVEGYEAVVRKDTGAVLNILGKNFQPVQNRDAFKFFDAVVGEGQAIYHTAGALGKGERVWMLAKLPGSIMVEAGDGKDEVEKFLLLANGHNGSLAFRMLFTPVRVVCQNTLTLALRQGAETGFTARHTENVAEKIGAARRALGIVIKQYDDFEAGVNKLARKMIPHNVLVDYIDECLPSKRGEKPELAIARRDIVTDMFYELPTCNVGHISGTWWAAYNAVTEYVDYGGEDVRKEVTGSRLGDILMGGRSRVKADAYTTALEMAGING